MESITMAIIAAITAGATKAAQGLIPDAYNGLKGLMQRKFGNDSKLIKAVNNAEEDPDETNQTALTSRVTQAKAHEDADILQAVEKLLAAIEHQEQDPVRKAAIGFNLREVKAKSLEIAQVKSTGTGVNIEKGIFEGDIKIGNVEAGIFDPK